MADILVVDCGSDSTTRSVLAVLDGLQVSVANSIRELQQLSQGVTTASPCGVLCITCSGRDRSRGLVDQTLRAVGLKPVLVIDECFNDDYGDLLLKQGALDYLHAGELSSARLLRHIEWAVLRNMHRAPTQPLQRDDAAFEERSELRRVHACLPPREREVLDLLLQRLPAKKIAGRRGTSVKTVHSQLASLRGKFNAASSQDLIILLLGALYQA